MRTAVGVAIMGDPDGSLSEVLTVSEDGGSVYCPDADMGGVVSFEFPSRVLRSTESTATNLYRKFVEPMIPSVIAGDNGTVINIGSLAGTQELFEDPPMEPQGR